MPKVKEAATTAVAEPQQESREVVQTTVPNEIGPASSIDEMFAEDAGKGLERMGAGDFAIPFLSILQKNSPQVSKANSKYIKGAESGMFLNTVSQEIYSGEEGILYVPCGYDKKYVEWTPRDSGGGFIASHSPTDPIIKRCKIDERNRLIDPETGHMLIDTAYHFGLLLHEASYPEPAVISMASTQLKASRMWNTAMRRIMKKNKSGELYNPASYSHVYRLTTIGQVKDQYDWFGFRIVSEGEVKEVPLYKMARDFAKQISSGTVRVSAPPQDSDDTVQGNGASSDDVPF